MFHAFFVAASVVHAIFAGPSSDLPIECETCLLSGRTWQPEAGECTNDCSIADISCYTPAIGCPGGCKTCLDSGRFWQPEATEEDKCTIDCAKQDAICTTPYMECPAIPEEHDCNSKQEQWTPEKKQWCCIHEGSGCAAHECDTKELWTPEKADWCCQQTGLACKTGVIRAKDKVCAAAQDRFKTTLQQRVNGFFGAHNYTIWCANDGLDNLNFVIAPESNSTVDAALALPLVECLNTFVARALKDARPEALNKTLAEYLTRPLPEALELPIPQALGITIPEAEGISLSEALDVTLAETLYSTLPDDLDSTVPDILSTHFSENKRGINLMLRYDMWKQECSALSESECKSAISHAPCVWVANTFNPGGKCEVSDQTCVENGDIDTCLEKSSCRWVPHKNLEEVSLVPCRPIRNNDELCAVYQNWPHCTNNPNCKWDTKTLKCGFNGCKDAQAVDQTCACSTGSADPQDTAPLCHYGQECRLSKADTVGPYTVVTGGCTVAVTLAPESNSCAEFWISSCKEGATDGTGAWRPVFDTWKVQRPAVKPEEKCCQQTCSVWEATGQSCGGKMLRPNVLCGDAGCSETKCCRPTCADFQCDANRPETLKSGSILKLNAQSIACKNEDGEENCTFTQCCEVTCLSKKGICDVLGKGGRRERLKNDPQSFLCSSNIITAEQIDIAITSDKCDHNYCCDLEFDTCQQANENGFSVCGKGDYVDWADKTEETKCGGTDDYKCTLPEHCCKRTCEEYLNFGDRHCPINYASNRPTFKCNKDCSQETCCVPTCASFECLLGLIPIPFPASNNCGEGDKCNESTCCLETCQSKQLASPTDFCPVGKIFRANLIDLVCGAGASNCMDNDKEFCCQKTCLHYTTNTKCPAHYNAKKENEGLTCGGSFPCSRDNCCEPTCNHFLEPLDMCIIKTDDTDIGFSAKPGIGNHVCSGFECTHGECCQRTCSQYLSGAVGGCKNGMIPNLDESNSVCDGSCSQKLCCFETCASWNDCAHDSGLKLDLTASACKTFGSGGCAQAKCCQANCLAFNQCDAGFIKKESADKIVCTGSSGSLADCNSSTCCRPTCASYKCPADFQTNENTARICEDGQCTTDQCCDTTCASWIAPAVAGTCDALHILVANPNTFRCDYKNKDDDIYDDALTCKNRCCRETCGSFLATTNAGSHDGKCAIDGLSIAKNHDVACDESPTESCTSDFCCEYTCAKFVIASCVGNGLTYRKETKHLGCSENPRPVALINQTYTAEIQRNGKLILKHLYPCDRVFCCETVCRKVPECPVNELRVSNSECNNLTTCNLHKCCKCGAGASCHPDPDKDMKTKRCTIDYDGQSKKCEELGQCAPANDKLDEVPQACSCHTDKELAASEKDPSQTTLTDVCTEYFSEVCRVKKPQGKRCTPKCVEGGNEDTCVCGSTICEANGYCQSGECQTCAGLSREYCSKFSAFCWWGAVGTETLPKSGCIAIRLTSGQALLGAVGGSSAATGGISVAATIGIAVGAVALLVAGVFTANHIRDKKSKQPPA